jgi:hypothetical protein
VGLDATLRSKRGLAHSPVMSALMDFVEQTASALVGTVVGGLIAAWVARWQTEAGAHHARFVAERERSAQAATQLLERLADLYAWLPSLPDVGEEIPRLSDHARKQCSSAIESVRRGIFTELLSVSDIEARARYRSLVQMIYDVGWRNSGRGYRERQIRDVRTYLRYIQHTLESVIDGMSLPPELSAPDLGRADDELWPPAPLPEYWSDPADGS